MNFFDLLSKENPIALASLLVAIITLLINFLAWRFPKHPTAIQTEQQNTPKRKFISTPLFISIFFLGLGILLLSSNRQAIRQITTQEHASSLTNKTKDTPSQQNSIQNKSEVDNIDTPTQLADNENSSTRFFKTECASIKDRKTGYEWLVGPDKNMSYEEAKKWVSSLNACSKDWTLPSSKEVKTLYDPDKTAGIGTFINGKHWPAKIDPVFNAIGSGSWIWLAENPNQDKALSFNLNQWNVVTVHPTGQNYTTRAFAISK